MPASPDLASLCSALATTEPERCRTLLGLLGEGLAAVDPEKATARALSRHPPDGADVTVVALGKASPAMARGADAVLGRRVRRWLVISEHPDRVPARAELLIGSHPLPDHSSLEAGRRLLSTVTEPTDHVVLLISGGGSALAEVPVRGVSLEDLVHVYDLLLTEGVPIEEANVVRSHLSAIKGGKLAAAIAAPITTIVLSDVGPHLEMVASGPSIPSSTSPAEALAVLSGRRLTDRVPAAAIAALETAPGSPPSKSGRLIMAGDGGTAAGAIAAAGRRLDLPLAIVTTALSGEAVAAAHWALGAVTEGQVGVLAGETTVTVRGRGRGGRNQEAALAAALVTEGGVNAFVTLGTDGIDGPTDSAGAYVDGFTAARVRSAGIDPADALARNDSHTALGAARALIRTGPTGINVADLWLVDRR